MISSVSMNCACGRLRLLVLLATLMGCAGPPEPDLVPLPAAEGAPLDTVQAAIVLEAMKHFPNGSQFALGFSAGDSVWYAGVERRNNSLVYVQNCDRAFEIGSITKTFTATMLAKLVYDGTVDLHEPIRNILPVPMHQSVLDGQQVELLHLANHTSGFPKEPDNIGTDFSVPGSPYRTFDEAKLYDFLMKRLTLRYVPGHRREYSNLGGGLLGHLLTLITQKSYEELLLESVCRPLGMERTFVTIDDERRQYLVPGRDPEGTIVPNWDLNVLVGAGGIKSTAADLTMYLHAHMTDTTYFGLTQQPTIAYTEHSTAGLGWAWYTNGKLKFVDASGGTGGYSCIVIFERSSQNAVIVLTNVSAFLAARGDYISKLGIALHNTIQYHNAASEAGSKNTEDAR